MKNYHKMKHTSYMNLQQENCLKISHFGLSSIEST